MQVQGPAAGRGDLQAERVRQPAPAGQHGRFEQRVADAGAQGGPGEHEVLPAGQVAEGGDDPAVADRLLGDVHPVPATARRRGVPGGQPGHRHREVVAEPGDGHAERPEQPLRGELGQRPPGTPADHRGGQDEPGVGVGPAGPGREVEVTLAGDQPHQPRLIHARHRHTGQLAQRVALAQATGVRQALAQRDRCAQPQSGQVSPDVIVQRQHSVGLQQHQARRGELLAGRGDVEHGAGPDRDVVLDHRAARGGLRDQRAVPVHPGRVTRAARRRERRDEAGQLPRIHRGTVAPDLRTRGHGPRHGPRSWAAAAP